METFEIEQENGNRYRDNDNNNNNKNLADERYYDEDQDPFTNLEDVDDVRNKTRKRDVQVRNKYIMIAALVCVAFAFGYITSHLNQKQQNPAPIVADQNNSNSNGYDSSSSQQQQQQQQQQTTQQQQPPPQSLYQQGQQTTMQQQQQPSQQQQQQQSQQKSQQQQQQPSQGSQTGTCAELCYKKQKHENQYSGINLLDGKSLVDVVNSHKEKLVTKIKRDYGEEYFDKIFTTDVRSTSSTTSTAYTSSTIPMENQFNRESVGRTMFRPVGRSWERLRNKLVMKLLLVHREILKTEKDRGDSNCQCEAGGSGGTRQRRHAQQQQQQQDNWSTKSSSSSSTFEFPEYLDYEDKEDHMYYTKFVYASAGHAGAAGQGNFYEEGYARILEKNLKDMFRSVGIDFIARQYGTHNQDSGTLSSMCMDSVYGLDVDALSWDYAMADSNHAWKLLMFAYHAGIQNPDLKIHDDAYYDHREHVVSPTAFLAFQISEGLRDYPARKEVVESVGDRGMIAFYQEHKAWEGLLDNVPDTNEMNPYQISQLPKNLKGLKCGMGKAPEVATKWNLETGGEVCNNEKFNMTMCPDRRWRVAWMRGWKWHALQGNLISLFFTELLLDAATEITNNSLETIGDRKELYMKIKQFEVQEYNRFMKSPVPTTIQDVDISFWDDSQISHQDFDLTTVLKSRSFCHTALLPADIRYRGILTQNNGKVGFSNYEMGISLEDANTYLQPRDTGTPRLVGTERQKNCPLMLEIDYDDYFYIHANEGWTTMTIPNQAEKQYYFNIDVNNANANVNSAGQPVSDLNSGSVIGVVLICLRGCDFGQCPAGNLKYEDVTNNVDGKDFEIEINDVKVTSHTVFGQCHAMKHDNGHIWKPSNPNDVSYQFRIRVNRPDSYLRITSFIIL